VHAALGAIKDEDYVGLSPKPEELVLGALAAAGTLGSAFDPKELAEATFHPAEYRPLTEDEAKRVIRIGMSGGLLKAHKAPNDSLYGVANEALREHLVALLDWLPDLPDIPPKPLV